MKIANCSTGATPCYLSSLASYSADGDAAFTLTPIVVSFSTLPIIVVLSNVFAIIDAITLAINSSLKQCRRDL